MTVEKPICDPCWLLSTGTFERAQDGEIVLVWYEIPEVVLGFPLELCCVCGAHTISGIYVETDLIALPNDSDSD